MFPAVEGKKVIGVRDLPFVISETSDAYVNGLYWTALTDGENGIAFFNRGTMGAVREEDGGFSMPLAYAMYYIWGTRMLRGDFVYEFALYPFTGAWQEADLHRRAIEYNYQPVAMYAQAGNGRCSDTIRPFTVTPAETIVSAFYNIGDDFFVRLYEHDGRSLQVSLEDFWGRTHMAEVDLAGGELNDVSGPFILGPRKIKTIRLRYGES